MPAFVRLILLHPVIAVGAALSLFGVGWWVVDTYRDGRAAEALVVELRADLASAKRSLETERARAASDLAAVAEEVDAQRARQDALDDLLDAITQSGPASDGPVAPVLLDTLRRLK